MAGIWDALLSLGLQGAGYLIKNRAEDKAADKRSAILREIETLNNQALNQKAAITQNQVASYAPAARVQALDSLERQATGRLQADLVGPDTTVDGPTYGGKVSEAFTTGKAQRAADELRYATKLASLMGRVAAPADQALEQSYANADAATARATVGSNLRGNIDNQQLALNAVEPNGGHLMAGDLLAGAGLAVGTPRDTSFGAPTPPPQPTPMAGGGASQIPMGASPNAVPGRSTGVNRSSQNAMLGRSPTAPGTPRPGSTAYWAGGRR